MMITAAEIRTTLAVVLEEKRDLINPMNLALKLPQSLKEAGMMLEELKTGIKNTEKFLLM